jgi:hypothetical protein
MELGKINTLEDLDNYFDYYKDNEIKLQQILIYFIRFSKSPNKYLFIDRLLEHGVELSSNIIGMLETRDTIELIKHLVSVNKNVNQFLLTAVNIGNFEVVKYLVENVGIDVNQQNRALPKAIEKYDVPMIKYLLMHGADQFVEDIMRSAIYLQDVDFCLWLLDNVDYDDDDINEYIEKVKKTKFREQRNKTKILKKLKAYGTEEVEEFPHEIEHKFTLDNVFEYSPSDLDTFIAQYTVEKYEELYTKRYMVIYYLYQNNYLDQETEALVDNNKDRFLEVLKYSHSALDFKNNLL